MLIVIFSLTTTMSDLQSDINRWLGDHDDVEIFSMLQSESMASDPHDSLKSVTITIFYEGR